MGSVRELLLGVRATMRLLPRAGRLVTAATLTQGVLFGALPVVVTIATAVAVGAALHAPSAPIPITSRPMATADDIRTTIERYVSAVGAADPDAIADLYARDATVEDPVGTETHVGRDAIHAFYKSVSAGGIDTEMVGKVNVVGLTAAFHFKVIVDGAAVVEPIDIMTFDNDAKITSMKAYWSFD